MESLYPHGNLADVDCQPLLVGKEAKDGCSDAHSSAWVTTKRGP